MKTNAKVIGAAMLFIALFIGISSCNTRNETEGPEETVETEEEKPEDTDTVAANRKPLTLILKNLPSADAPIMIGVYGTKNKFPNPKDQLKQYTFIPDGKEFTIEITDLKFGTYALALYQDENSNGKIDKNFIGIPTEAYAFSNNFKPTVRAPNFSECQFKYSASANEISIEMIQ